MADSLSFSCKVGTLKAEATRTFPTDSLRSQSQFVADMGANLLQAALSSATNNNVVGGSDTVLQGVLDIAVSNTATLDLKAFTELDGDANAALARVKFVAFWLPAYSSTNTTLSTIGSNATSVTIGNSGANAAALFLGANTHTVSLKNGGWLIHSDPSAAGYTIDATHKDLLVTNPDATNAAKLSYLIVGGSN